MARGFSAITMSADHKATRPDEIVSIPPPRPLLPTPPASTLAFPSASRLGTSFPDEIVGDHPTTTTTTTTTCFYTAAASLLALLPHP